MDENKQQTQKQKQATMYREPENQNTFRQLGWSVIFF